MSGLQHLRSEIRDLIHNPRRRDPLLKNIPNWNKLASSFDVIADTEMAIVTFETLPEPDNDKGYLYLIIYGLLQALYVQQDAVESLVRGFNPSQTPRYKIEDEPEAKEIRDIRNAAIGHPTVHGNANSSKTPGVQMSFHISQFSMRKNGFTLMTAYADGRHTMKDIDLVDLIRKNRAMLERVLQRVKDEQETIEMEHRAQFRGEKLVNIFPATMDYQFEKVYEGARRLGTGDGVFGKISLDVIIGYVAKFKDALTKRGTLNATSDLRFFFDEVEYPLTELHAYFQGTGSLKDPRAADIFTHFAQAKMRELVKIAQEIDEEYAEVLGQRLVD
jgi:hypothetical protein